MYVLNFVLILENTSSDKICSWTQFTPTEKKTSSSDLDPQNISLAAL